MRPLQQIKYGLFSFSISQEVLRAVFLLVLSEQTNLSPLTTDPRSLSCCLIAKTTGATRQRRRTYQTSRGEPIEQPRPANIDFRILVSPRNLKTYMLPPSKTVKASGDLSLTSAQTSESSTVLAVCGEKALTTVWNIVLEEIANSLKSKQAGVVTEENRSVCRGWSFGEGYHIDSFRSRVDCACLMKTRLLVVVLSTLSLHCRRWLCYLSLSFRLVYSLHSTVNYMVCSVTRH